MAKQEIIKEVSLDDGYEATFKASELTTLKLPKDFYYYYATKTDKDLILKFDKDNTFTLTVTIKDYFKNPKSSKFKYIMDSDGDTTNVYNSLANNVWNLNLYLEESGQLKGTEFADYIEGSSGNDIIKAGNGENIVYGGAGDDIIYGGNDNDNLYGDSPMVMSDAISYNDTIYTGKGDDYVDGGKGDDKIYINGKGIKTIDIFAENGNDTIYGASKATSVNVNMREYDDGKFTKQGNDLIVTGIYDETTENLTVKDAFKAIKKVNIDSTSLTDIYANSDIDIKYANINKKETLKGTDKNNTIIGGDNKDTIYTGAGNDEIYGGKGQDTIYINGSGTKTIHISDSDKDTISGTSTTGAKTVLKYDSLANVTDIGYDSLDDSEKTTALSNILSKLDFSKTGNNLEIKTKEGASSGSGELVSTEGLYAINRGTGILIGDDTDKMGSGASYYGTQITSDSGLYSYEIKGETMYSTRPPEIVSLSEVYLDEGGENLRTTNPSSNYKSLSEVTKLYSYDRVIDDNCIIRKYTEEDDLDQYDYYTNKKEYDLSKYSFIYRYKEGTYDSDIGDLVETTSSIKYNFVQYVCKDGDDYSLATPIKEYDTIIKDFFKNPNLMADVKIGDVALIDILNASSLATIDKQWKLDKKGKFVLDKNGQKIAQTGKQSINGTLISETIKGGLGADTIKTGGGDDEIYAGKGKDTIVIDGAGTKTIHISDADKDTIKGMATTGATTVLKYDDLSGVKTVDDVLKALKFSQNGKNLEITNNERVAGSDELTKENGGFNGIYALNSGNGIVLTQTFSSFTRSYQTEIADTGLYSYEDKDGSTKYTTGKISTINLSDAYLVTLNGKEGMLGSLTADSNTSHIPSKCTLTSLGAVDKIYAYTNTNLTRYCEPMTEICYSTTEQTLHKYSDLYLQEVDGEDYYTITTEVTSLAVKNCDELWVEAVTSWDGTTSVKFYTSEKEYVTNKVGEKADFDNIYYADNAHLCITGDVKVYDVAENYYLNRLTDYAIDKIANDDRWSLYGNYGDVVEMQLTEASYKEVSLCKDNETGELYIPDYTGKYIDGSVYTVLQDYLKDVNVLPDVKIGDVSLADALNSLKVNGRVLSDDMYDTTNITNINKSVKFNKDGSIKTDKKDNAVEVTAKQTIKGTALNEVIMGGKGADKIYGYGGDDSIWLNGGSDTVDGGEGSDEVILSNLNLKKDKIVINDTGKAGTDTDILVFTSPSDLAGMNLLFDVRLTDEGYTVGDDMYFIDKDLSTSAITGNKKTNALTLKKGIIATGIEKFECQNSTTDETVATEIDDSRLNKIASDVASWLNSDGRTYDSVADVFASKNSDDITAMLNIFNPDSANAWKIQED